MADKVISRDALLAAADERRSEYVEIPGMDGGVYVRELSGSELDAYQASLMRQVGGEFQQDFTNSTAKLVARCAYTEDKDGQLERIFDPSKDVGQVGELPSHILQPIAEAARKVNGMTNEAQEEMEGNSEEAGEDSTSA